MMTLLDTSSPPTWASPPPNPSKPSRQSRISRQSLPPDPIEWCRTSPATARPQVTPWVTPWVTPCQLWFAKNSTLALLHRTPLAKKLLPAHPWNSRAAEVPKNNEKRIWEIMRRLVQKMAKRGLLHSSASCPSPNPNIWHFTYDIVLNVSSAGLIWIPLPFLIVYQCLPSGTCDSIWKSAAESPSRKRRSTNRSCAFQSTAQTLQIRTAPQPHRQRPREVNL